MRPSNDSRSESTEVALPQTNGSSNGLSSPRGSHNGEHMNGNGVPRPLSDNTSVVPAVGDTGPTFYGHDRGEMTKLILQALRSLNYDDAASALEKESGIEMEGPAITRFREAVLQGRWSDVEHLLLGSAADKQITSAFDDGTRMDGMESGYSTPDSHSWSQDGLAWMAEKGNLSSSTIRQIRFHIRKEKFLELLEARKLIPALRVLQREIQPVAPTEAELNKLSSYLLCSSTELMRTKADWFGVAGGSRLEILSVLATYVPAAMMIPDFRLEILLRQVKDHWIHSCLHHTSTLDPSLYEYHECSPRDFPQVASHTLADHEDEVWFVKYSNAGKRLATASKDKTIMIYETVDYVPLTTLAGHSSGVCFVSWSPDDLKLLSCAQGTENAVKLWDITTGQCLFTVDHYFYAVTAVAWDPTGESFVIGSQDTKNAIQTHDLEGNLIHDWDLKLRVHDMGLTPDGSKLIVATETRVYVFDYHTHENIYEMTIYQNDDAKLTSLAVSSDSRYFLISMNPDEIRLVDLDTSEATALYMGHAQKTFIIRSAFGGQDSNFVVSGSEDKMVYIWRRNGHLICKLAGHQEGCVNAVAWHPRNTRQLASAGDDKTVRIWSAPSVHREDAWFGGSS